MAQRTITFPLGGGLDLATPASSMPPGRVTGAINYEPDEQEGYRRMKGFERFDGRPSPSEADYWTVQFTGGSNEPAANATLTGATSGASATVLFAVVQTGGWATNDAAGYFIFGDITDGPFQAGENIIAGSTQVAVVSSSESRNKSSTNDEHKQYLLAAQALRRAAINPVPGSGPIRGVWIYKKTNKVYAIRDSADGSQGIMHESGPTGWVQVPLGSALDYTTGQAKIYEGDTLTGAASGATATVASIGVTTGDLYTGDAAGSVYLTGISGTFQSGETINASSGGSLVASGTVYALTLPPAGRYEFREFNFRGALDTRYLFGVNGVGRAFRFDGTSLQFIHVTGLNAATDKPEHLAEHKNHLFLSVGSTAFHSGTGEPMDFDTTAGAGQIATGDKIVGMDAQVGGVLAIYNRNSTYLLYGNDDNDFTLHQYSAERGAIEWSLQNLMLPFYMDDRGMAFLNPTDAFGDFKAQTVSEVVDPIIQQQKKYVLSSVRIKDKNQYRVHFEDNTGLLAMIRPDLRIEFMPFNYGMRVLTICAEEDASGNEQVFFGSDDGYIYQAEKGESFDGQDINYYLRFVYFNCKMPRVNKRFHKITYLIDGTEPPVIRYIPDFSFGNPDVPAPKEYTIDPSDIHTGGGYWGETQWGEFIWGGQPVGEAEAYVDGVGFNVSITIKGESHYEGVHTLKSATIYFTPRGLSR